MTVFLLQLYLAIDPSNLASENDVTQLAKFQMDVCYRLKSSVYNYKYRSSNPEGAYGLSLSCCAKKLSFLSKSIFILENVYSIGSQIK